MAAVSHKWHRGNIATEGTNTTQAGGSRACRAFTDPITFLCMHKAVVRLVANFGGCTSSGKPGESPENRKTVGVLVMKVFSGLVNVRGQQFSLRQT